MTPAVMTISAAEKGKLLADLQASDPVQRGHALDALAALGDARLCEQMHSLLKDQDSVVAFKAAIGLAQLGDDRGVDLLLSGLRSADLRSFALDALIDLGPEAARDRLKKFMGRLFLHPLERMQAAAALARAGDPAGSTYLEDRLKSKRPEERGFALELWGRLSMPEAYKKLMAVFVDESDPHRLDALRGLVHLNDSRALDVFEQVGTETSDPELAAEARWAAEVLREGA